MGNRLPNALRKVAYLRRSHRRHYHKPTYRLGKEWSLKPRNFRLVVEMIPGAFNAILLQQLGEAEHSLKRHRAIPFLCIVFSIVYPQSLEIVASKVSGIFLFLLV